MVTGDTRPPEDRPELRRLLAWIGDAELPGAPGVSVADEVRKTFAALAASRPAPDHDASECFVNSHCHDMNHNTDDRR